MLNPLSLEALALWLEKQDPNARYVFDDPFNCLCHQYLKASGFPVVSVTPNHWYDKNDEDHPLPEHWNDIALGRDDMHLPRDTRLTFGAASARTKALLSKEQAVV